MVTFEARIRAGTRPRAFASRHARSWIGTIETAGESSRSTDGIRNPERALGTSPSDETTTTEAPGLPTRSAESRRSRNARLGFGRDDDGAQTGTRELERSVPERGRFVDSAVTPHSSA